MFQIIPVGFGVCPFQVRTLDDMWLSALANVRVVSVVPASLSVAEPITDTELSTISKRQSDRRMTENAKLQCQIFDEDCLLFTRNVELIGPARLCLFALQLVLGLYECAFTRAFLVDRL
jgi:hypothetical protein